MSATAWLIIAIVGFSLSGIALIAAIFMFVKMNISGVIGDLSGKTVAREIKAMRSANSTTDKKNRKSTNANVSSAAKDNKSDSSARAAAHASKRLDKTGSKPSEQFGKGAVAQPSVVPQRERTDTPFNTATNNPQDRSTTVLPQRSTDVLREDGHNAFPNNQGTAVLPNNRQTDILAENRQTDILAENRQTEVLTDNRQTDVLTDNRQTDVLTDNRQTDVLSDDYAAASDERAGTTVLGGFEEPVAESIAPVAFKVTRSFIRIHTNEAI